MAKMGRPPGIPNKATTAAREAISQFVDQNSPRLVEWLNQVSNGIREKDADGNDRWLVQPNPARAFELFQSVVEYHIPKLARMEVAGDQNNPIKVEQQVTLFGELVKNLKLQRQTESD